ncbi:ESCRT-II complex, vps25 subunit [Serendipita vermifera]|nr:ESCRT-II complex, vps25 subunit [Serendipita vermifera]
MEPRKFQTHVTESGFTLPSIHAFPPFFCFQPYSSAKADQEEIWTRLILSYARHRRLFTLSADDGETTTSPWREVLTNERIKRKLNNQQVTHLIKILVGQGVAAYEPPKQLSSVLVFWRKPEEWAEVLHGWAVSTGQLNTILTFYEIQNPQLESELQDLPAGLLRRAIIILTKSNRAQLIESIDGDGVRLFAGS